MKRKKGLAQFSYYLLIYLERSERINWRGKIAYWLGVLLGE